MRRSLHPDTLPDLLVLKGVKVKNLENRGYNYGFYKEKIKIFENFVRKFKKYSNSLKLFGERNELL